MAEAAVPAIARAMRILDLLAEQGQMGLGVTEIATRTGIAKSTTALLCGQLEAEGLLRRHENRYRLGRRLLSLASDYLAGVDHLGEFYDEVRSQPLISRHAARLALLEGTEVIYLARYEVGRSRRLSGAIGDRFPASITASGKAILSTLPHEVVEDRYHGRVLPRFTERSITTLPGLLAELEATRERGWAIDDEETNLGQVCYSIPVLDEPGGTAQLAVSTTLPTQVARATGLGSVLTELRAVAAVFENPLAGRGF